nr:DUF1931 family protein [Thermococcus sp.]
MEPIRKYVLRKISGDIPLEEEVVNELPVITGTLFVLVGRVIKALHPEIKNVYPEHIEEGAGLYALIFLFSDIVL